MFTTPATMSRINETNVSHKPSAPSSVSCDKRIIEVNLIPGPVLLTRSFSGTLAARWCTSAYRAMSTAKARRVNTAASAVKINGNRMRFVKMRQKEMKAEAVAKRNVSFALQLFAEIISPMGWIASPLVHDALSTRLPDCVCDTVQFKGQM